MSLFRASVVIRNCKLKQVKGYLFLRYEDTRQITGCCALGSLHYQLMRLGVENANSLMTVRQYFELSTIELEQIVKENDQLGLSFQQIADNLQKRGK